MIVVCPSCQQRYRHHLPLPTPAPQAHCSACDTRFEFTRPKRPYVLSAAIGSAAPVSRIEIDLPHPDPATRYPSDLGVMAVAGRHEPAPAVAAPRAPELVPAAAAAHVPKVAPSVPAAAALDAPAEPVPVAAADYTPEVAEPVPAAAEHVPEVAPPVPAAEPPRRRRSTWRSGTLSETVVALVPCAIGAFVAYHFAGRLSQDPFTWAALGGAVGLLVGWACLLCVTPGD